MGLVCIKKEDQWNILHWLLDNRFEPEKHLAWLLEYRSKSNAKWDKYKSTGLLSADNQITLAQTIRDVIDAVLFKQVPGEAWGRGYSMLYLRLLSSFIFNIPIANKNKKQLIKDILEAVKP